MRLRLVKRFFRNQPDDFAGSDGDAVSRGFAADEFKDARHGRLVGVGQVHRDLRQAREPARPWP